jgi:hypothetical protein
LRDIDTHWAREAIESAFEKGLVHGYEDGSFQPERAISRAEFLQILYNLFGSADSGDVAFSDLPTNEWYYECIKWGVAAGLTTGYEDNTFRGDLAISREEAAVMLSRCAGLPTEAQSVSFHDAASISDWARDSVTKVAERGIMRGDDKGNFAPTASLTRAEMAVIAGRLA